MNMSIADVRTMPEATAPSGENPPSKSRGRTQSSRGRILYVIGSLDFGGAEFHLRMITPALRHRGWKPTIYCLAQRGAQAEDVEADGVEVIAPPVKPDSRLPTFLCLTIQATLSGGKLLWLLLRRRPDIVHFYLPGAYLIGGPLSVLARTPIRIMSRRSLDNYQAHWPHLRRVELWLHKRMSVILGNSSAVVEQLIDREGCPSSKVHLIHNGIDLSRYGSGVQRSQTRAALDVPESARVAVIVANLIPYKGHADLLRGLASIRDEMPENWLLLAVGRDDGALDELQRLTRELGLSDNVRFTGLREDVPALLAAADIGVLSSHQEGFSNALIEAMASGLPMVATDVGGNSDAVIDGETGYIVPPHAPEQLGAAIASLMNDLEKAKAMGQSGRQRAHNLYSLERCVGAYNDLYQSLRKATR